MDLKHPTNDLRVVFDFPLSLFYLHQALERMCPQTEVFTHTQRYSSVSKKSLKKTLVSVAAVFCVLNCLNKNHCF